MSKEDSMEFANQGSSVQVLQETSDGNSENVILGQLGGKFQSRDKLISMLKEIFSRQGYALSIKGSRKDKYVDIGCDRGGCYRDTRHVPMDQRKKNTTTRLINCPFLIKGKRIEDGSWIVEVKCLSHNHEPSSDMSGHPSCRHLSRDEIKSVEELTRSGVPPRQILSSLRQKNPKLQAVSRTIYNMKSKLLKENLAGRNAIQALLEELHEGDFIYHFVHDLERHLTHLFFAHPLSIKLSKSYSSTFVMDCTYKTNKYKMPLLDIIGVSSFNTSFYSCFAFLKKEEEEDYVWALNMFGKMLGSNVHPSVIATDRELALMNAIKVVFPTTTNLLCVWHIEKNILAHCKPSFETQDDWESFLALWKQVMESQDEASFEEMWKHFESSYKEKENILGYIRSTWLPFKDRFVRAWTDKYPHFGNRVSSRAEGAHAKLKSYLQVSTGDLRQVKSSICLAVANEFQEIKTQLESEKIRIPHKCNVPFFKELVTNVSMFAMGEILKQYDMVKDGKMQPLCTGNFNASMGLPCAHMMAALDGKTLPLDSIHSQWRIDKRCATSFNGNQIDGGDNFNELLQGLEVRYKDLPPNRRDEVRGTISQLVTPSPLLLYEPNIQKHKGRPSGSKKRKVSSTRRDPSKFEIVEATRKCSFCDGVGHNIRTCQKKLVMNKTHASGSNKETNMIDLNVEPCSPDSVFMEC